MLAFNDKVYFYTKLCHMRCNNDSLECKIEKKEKKSFDFTQFTVLKDKTIF